MIEREEMPRVLDILRHMLGLDQAKEPYRNHYVAGEGHHSQSILLRMEEAGLVKRMRTPSFCPPSDVCFTATERGQEMARLYVEVKESKKRAEVEEELSDE